MTQAASRDFMCSRPIFTLKDSTVIRTWKNPVRVDHLFLADREGGMIFAGFVGWIHSKDLEKAIVKIERELAQ